eukprot:NODE_1508_length_1143_cov_7.088665_g1229_i0.p1 GENE.NODE_1508_length_1143_cov_7.088665_g1229_i0~~NODE_1508_length_1143_cov_7.088665_g1229_i0.p1  ORF type:complete len:51 (-),score=1.28 NODE_1508_length_1143_cov_7.088665_g1229_i0:441-593(-)
MGSQPSSVNQKDEKGDTQSLSTIIVGGIFLLTQGCPKRTRHKNAESKKTA